MWRFHKAWCVSRITKHIFLIWLGVRDSLVTLLTYCPLCSKADADLFHILCTCKGTLGFRREWGEYNTHHAFLRVLSDTPYPTELYVKVKYFGRCLAECSANI